MPEVAKTVAVVVQLAFHLIVSDPQPVFISYYGTVSDGYIGQHHGAYWHGDSCGLPDVVDDIHFGTAAPRWIPYCSNVLICLDVGCVLATVVDRQRDDVIGGMPHIDAWPAVAAYLGILDDGIAIFDMYVLEGE